MRVPRTGSLLSNSANVMKDHIFGTHHVFRLTPSQWALLAENCQPSLTRYLLALHVHQTNQASEGWKPTPNLEHDRFVRVATLQEIAQRLASLPEFCHQESGDGNRIAALVIETLASVLEGGFDEGGCVSIYVAVPDVRT